MVSSTIVCCFKKLGGLASPLHCFSFSDFSWPFLFFIFIIKFQISLSSFWKKSCCYFYCNHDKFIAQLQEKWHLYNAELYYQECSLSFHLFNFSLYLRNLLKFSFCGSYSFVIKFLSRDLCFCTYFFLTVVKGVFSKI